MARNRSRRNKSKSNNSNTTAAKSEALSKNVASDQKPLTETTSSSSHGKVLMAGFVAVAAIATAGWIHRDELGWTALLTAPLQEGAANQSWQTDASSSSSSSPLLEQEQQYEGATKDAGREMNDDELRDLAKFWSNNKATPEEEVKENAEEEEEEEEEEEMAPLTHVSIAPYHNYNVKGMEQKADMIKYMCFDDGYTTCINVDDLERDFNLAPVVELKHSKFLLLQRMANIPKHWSVRIPERSEATILDDYSVFQDLLPTCRLLTLTQEEFRGKANQILKEALQSDDQQPLILADKVSNASEFRTMVCLARLIDEFLRVIPDPTQRAAMESLKQTWSEIAKESYQAAEPVPVLPEGWRELSNDKSGGHAYYVSELTGSTSWIRPLPQPFRRETNNHAQTTKKASLVARSKPCDETLSEWMLAGH